MVKLVVSDFNGDSELEKLLAKTNIEYQLCLAVEHKGIQPPHLIVDGVPLDEKRSFKWVETHLK